MACDAEDCGFQMLNDDEIVTSVQEEPDSIDDETDEDEDINDESSKGPSNADAFSALESAMEWYEQQSECCPIQQLLLKRIRSCSKKKKKKNRSYTMCPAWVAFGFRLSEQSRIRTVSSPY
ncbi:uncharacterized protein TNCV_2616021 [Trichonephila clavipes]|nr:uncharacterized protein TNCV_2616021 [Trichonephila clavipes]